MSDSSSSKGGEIFEAGAPAFADYAEYLLPKPNVFATLWSAFMNRLPGSSTQRHKCRGCGQAIASERLCDECWQDWQV